MGMVTYDPSWVKFFLFYKLSSESNVRKKAAGIWEMLSQEFAWTVSEEHGERIRAITDEMIKR
jgi:hypothetical protein